MATLTPLHTGQYRTENTSGGILMSEKYSNLSLERSTRQADFLGKKG